MLNRYRMFITAIAVALAVATSCTTANLGIVDQSAIELTSHNFDFQIEVSCTVHNSGSGSGEARVVATLDQVGVNTWTRQATGRVAVGATRSFTLLFSEPLYRLPEAGYEFECTLG